MDRILLIVISLFMITTVSAQSKSERKKNKIKSITEWETVTTEGKTNAFKSVVEEFDRSGRSIQKTEYGPDGSVMHKETAVYDTYGNKTEETEIDVDKHRNVRRAFRYNAMKDKTEEIEYNSAGIIQKKTLFTYDANGNKVGETVNDATGNCLKKIQYTYNSKKLKIKKEVIRASVQAELIKKWDYVYY